LLDQVGLNQVWSNQVRLNRNRVDVAGSVVERVNLENCGASDPPNLSLLADPNSANDIIPGRR
jgi:hypothetical protein